MARLRWSMLRYWFRRIRRICPIVNQLCVDATGSAPQGKSETTDINEGANQPVRLPGGEKSGDLNRGSAIFWELDGDPAWPLVCSSSDQLYTMHCDCLDWCAVENSDKTPENQSPIRTRYMACSRIWVVVASARYNFVGPTANVTYTAKKRGCFSKRNLPDFRNHSILRIFFFELVAQCSVCIPSQAFCIYEPETVYCDLPPALPQPSVDKVW